MATLTLSDINLAEQYVRVLGKGNKPDFCPFSNKTGRVLWLYLAERKPRARTSTVFSLQDLSSYLVASSGKKLSCISRFAVFRTFRHLRRG
jgi:site-specific recombinase XerD